MTPNTSNLLRGATRQLKATSSNTEARVNEGFCGTQYRGSLYDSVSLPLNPEVILVLEEAGANSLTDPWSLGSRETKGPWLLLFFPSTHILEAVGGDIVLDRLPTNPSPHHST